MRLPGLRRARQAVRWIHSRYDRAAVILGYHRVAEVTHDAFDICITPQHFSEQLQVLKRIATPVSLATLLDGLKHGDLPEHAIAITFDDGYVDFLHEAAPLLEQYNMPATLFITAGYLGSTFWWDKLENMIFAADELPTEIHLTTGERTFHWDRTEGATDETSSNKRRLVQSLYQWLLHLEGNQRENAIRQLNDTFTTFDNTLVRVLTEEELSSLSGNELLEFGSHSHTHPMLATLPIAAQRQEIKAGKTRLELLLQRPVVSFSYPNGSYSEDTIAILQESGFTSACTSVTDVVRKTGDHLQLPRFWPSNWGAARFERWVRPWL